MVAERKLDVKNTAIKFGLDQTLGAIFNNSAFLVAIRLMRGGPLESCITALREVRSLVCLVAFGTIVASSMVQFPLPHCESRRKQSILARQSANTLFDASQELLPILFAGYRLWPLVSILNFTVVPVERRVVVGSLVGLGWGVFLALRTAI